MLDGMLLQGKPRTYKDHMDYSASLSGAWTFDRLNFQLDFPLFSTGFVDHVFKPLDVVHQKHPTLTLDDAEF
jgi:hypothetical protein